jgi:hypothetical protein
VLAQHNKYHTHNAYACYCNRLPAACWLPEQAHAGLAAGINRMHRQVQGHRNPPFAPLCQSYTDPNAAIKLSKPLHNQLNVTKG